MKIKQTILTVAIFAGICMSLIGVSVSAAVGEKCGDETLQVGQSCCGGVVTSIINCSEKNDGSGVCPDGSTMTEEQVKAGNKCPDGSNPDVIQNTGLWGLLLLVINIMTAGVGILAVGGVVYGSIIYATATDSMEQKKKAKMIIFNVVIGILVYAFMYSFLNFIVPGGVFN
jgi:hypothetical protein